LRRLMIDELGLDSRGVNEMNEPEAQDAYILAT